MPAPVVNVKSSGVQRLSNAPSGGIGDELGSLTSISPTAILSRLNNGGTVVQAVRGDGVIQVPIAGSTPAGLVPGDVFLQSVAGVVYWCYVDSASVVHQLTSGSPSPVVPTVFPLTISVSQQLDTVLVDTGGCIQWQCSISDLITGRRAIYTIAVVNDGTNSSDAANAGICITGGAAIGVIDVGSQVTFTVTFTGSGVSQHMNLFVTPSVANLQAAIVRTPLVTT